MASETLFVDTSGARLRVRLDGPPTGMPVMFSNSLGAMLEMWDDQIAALARDFRCIRYDVRGHGESSSPPGPYSLRQLASDALRVLDALHIHKAHWIGCSMGGMVGMWLLTHHRDRVGKAVLGNTAAFMGPPATDWNARIRMAREGRLGEIAEMMKPRWFTKGFNDAHPDIVARVTGPMTRADPEGYASCCAAIRDMDQREAIRSITNPVLVVIGAEDPSTIPELTGLVASSIPGAKKIVLPAAHISNCEVPDLYNKAVGKFLRQ